MRLFDTGIRPAVDDYLKKKSEEERDYGEYWSASSAGYCLRLNIMRRLKVPPVPEIADSGARTRIFESGHIFHGWMQDITKKAGLSIAQELELQDEELMVRGHIDDLVLVPGPEQQAITYGNAVHSKEGSTVTRTPDRDVKDDHLILYDYKTQNSMAFSWQKGRPMSYYHKMQLGTYLYMLRQLSQEKVGPIFADHGHFSYTALQQLTEARILKISKDDLRMTEQQLMWSEELETLVRAYWDRLNTYWKIYQKTGQLPECDCLKQEGGFMGKRSSKGKVYNDYFYEEEPCSQAWFDKWLASKAEKE